MGDVTWVEDLFSTIDRMDAEAFAGFITEDGSFRFANWPQARGREAIVETVGQFFAGISGISHDLVGVWTVPGQPPENRLRLGSGAGASPQQRLCQCGRPSRPACPGSTLSRYRWLYPNERSSGSRQSELFGGALFFDFSRSYPRGRRGYE